MVHYEDSMMVSQICTLRNRSSSRVKTPFYTLLLIASLYIEIKMPEISLLELTFTGEYGFLLPKEQILPTAEETTAGLFAMAKEVLANI